MPPVPVYNNTPLHPQGITPQTVPPPDQQQQTPPSTQTIGPKPTSTIQPSTGPPPPQPGARPAAPTTSSASEPFFSDLPPSAPQPGDHPAPDVLNRPVVTETHTTTITSQGGPTAPPAQFSVPAPTTGHMGAPSKSTIYDAGSNFRMAPSSAGNNALPPTASPYESGGIAGGIAGGYAGTAGAAGGAEAGAAAVRGAHKRQQSLQHPPGYEQNPYAADGSPEDRARFEEAARQHREEEGVMGTVMGLLGQVGEGLKKAEEGVWKVVGGK